MLKKKGYLIHESRNGFAICRIIKECSTKEEAIKGLVLSLTGCDEESVECSD